MDHNIIQHRLQNSTKFDCHIVPLMDVEFWLNFVEFLLNKAWQVNNRRYYRNLTVTKKSTMLSKVVLIFFNDSKVKIFIQYYYTSVQLGKIKRYINKQLFLVLLFYCGVFTKLSLLNFWKLFLFYIQKENNLQFLAICVPAFLFLR